MGYSVKGKERKYRVKKKTTDNKIFFYLTIPLHRTVLPLGTKEYK